MNSAKKPMSLLKNGEKAIVDASYNEPAMKRRLFDLGFAPGSRVECIGTAAFGDPKAFLIKNTVIALRCEDSEKIYVRCDEQNSGIL